MALLLASTALAESPRSLPELAAALLSVDHPAEALAALDHASRDEPWVRWWRAIALGQAGRLEDLAGAIDHAAEDATGPDARDVARRLADLGEELGTLRDGSGDGRFAILGHRARPDRRALLGGRSSAAFLVDPSWERLRVIRLAPSDGPRAGNRAHLAHDETLEAVRRGDPGASREVPDDVPPPLGPDELLGALREDRLVRDRGLLELAEEVREERHGLRVERMALEDERDKVRSLLRAASAAPPDNALVPRTPAAASRLLDLAPGASPEDVERAYRAAIVRCHPDRVADLHPEIHGTAEQLTVALNAARDMLAAAATAERRRA